MDKELFAKLYNDVCFHDFCNMVDELRNIEFKIDIPLKTEILLINAKVNYIKGKDIEIMHNMVKNFLFPNGLPVSKTTLFFDYFVITNIMWIADGKIERLENGRFKQLPLDLTGYANSIYEFNNCTCGHKPKIFFSNFINALRANVICEKCGLKVSKGFVYNDLHPHKPICDVYVNLEEGIKKLSDLWNEEVEKNESILHRTMRELLSYGSNVCVNPVISDLHDKLYGYMVDKNIYRKPEYWNEPGYWDVATDKMMECPEPVQWVENYIWETQPCKLSV